MTGFLMLVFILALLAGAVASVAGFGIGSLLTPLLAVRVGVKAAVSAVSIPHFIATMLRLWMLRHHVDRRVLFGFGLMPALCVNAREVKHKVLGARESHVGESIECSRGHEMDARALSRPRRVFMAASPWTAGDTSPGGSARAVAARRLRGSRADRNLKDGGIKITWRQYIKVTFVVIPPVTIVTLVLLYYWVSWLF